MVNLQQTFNQVASIAALLYTQTAGFKAKQEQIQLAKEQKNTINAAQNIKAQIEKDKENINNLVTDPTDENKDSIKMKTDIMTDLINKNTDILKKQAMGGNVEAFNKLTDPNRIKAIKELPNVKTNIDKVFDAARKAQESLKASQEEARNSRIVDYRDKIWNYDIDYEPVLKETFNKVKPIIEEEKK